MSDITNALARFFSELSLEDVPEHIRHEGKRILLDTLGCLIGGRFSELAPVSDKLAGLFGGSLVDQASVPGYRKTSILGAVYANARLANALDFDETFPVGVHFGVGAVSSALAFAEARNATGHQLLEGVIAGYELGARVATYIGPMVKIADGSVQGFAEVWGAAAPVVAASVGAAAKILGFNQDQFRQALGHALSNCPLPAGSLWSHAVDLPSSKYCDAGWCAMTGAFAAFSVEAGSTSFDNPLDGPLGLARMCGVTEFDEALLVRNLGKQWLVEDVTYKLWPTCRFTHYALTSLERILRREALRESEILEIVIETGPMAGSLRFTKPVPVTFASRCFSYPHMVAMLVRGIPAGPLWLTAEIVEDPKTLAIAEKVRVVQHPRGGDFAKTMINNQVRTMPGGARVVTTCGTFRDEDDYALGDPWTDETRVSDEDLKKKFQVMSGEGGQEVINLIMDIESQPTLKSLISLLDSIIEAVKYAPENN